MRRQLIGSVMAACLVAPTSVRIVNTQGPQHGDHAAAKTGPTVDAVRKAIDRFRDVNDAIAEGYAQFQGCVSGPAGGAMGVHFAKGELFDGTVDVLNPEVLVYEPRNGRLHLVAAEYVVPTESWDPTHDEFDKPNLMGHLFQYLASPNRYGGTPVYELHVWAMKPNALSAFADWNPNVSCADWDGQPFQSDRE
jgi:hypothetical protein